MHRKYFQLIQEHVTNLRQMVFLAGPRQVGKTTLSSFLKDAFTTVYYFNWDNADHRQLIMSGSKAVEEFTQLLRLRDQKPIIIFDEIHKFRRWKNFLKGFFDVYEDKCKIVVTGSARLDLYRRGGDSLMGRYFLYRIHPLSIGELLQTPILETEIQLPKEISVTEMQRLLQFGGFPEPFINQNMRFLNNWQRLRKQQLLREDIRSLSQIQDFSELEILSDLLIENAANLINVANLAKQMRITESTIHRWIKTLQEFYYCYTIKPWHTNVQRSLRKMPKLYLWDWSLIKDNKGKKIENFIASHLYKAAQFWTDSGLGDFELYFLRDKEMREVDFLMVRNHKPWFLVEVKSTNNQGISKHLYYYQKMLNIPHAFQVVYDLPYVNADCFQYHEPVIVPAITFLSQLV